jgi:phenylacetate-CoA ligase
VHRTSGSTGEPRSYFRDRRSLVAAAAHFSRVLTIAARAAGKRLGLIQASILPPVSSAVNAQRAYRAGSLVALTVRNTHLSLLDPPEVNLARLNELKPDVVFTFGSYVEALFAHLGQSRQAFHPPAAIIYSADPLSDSIRRQASDEYGIQVLSTYQAAEMPLIAFECEHHSGLHANVDLYPLRIVGPGGEEVGTGEDGEVIVSNLVNRGTVLLNYRLGDLARRLPAACACGRNLPLVSLAEGRSEDWLVTEAGSLVHPQAISMWVHKIPGIWRYQAVQEEPTRFTMNLVAAPGTDRTAIRAQVERELEAVLGEHVELEISFSDSLPRSRSGKVQPVISKVRPRPSAPP